MSDVVDLLTGSLSQKGIACRICLQQDRLHVGLYLEQVAPQNPWRKRAKAIAAVYTRNLPKIKVVRNL